MSLEKNFWWSSLCTFWSIAFSWDRFLPSCYARCYWWWWWCFWSWKQAAKEVHPVMSWHFSFFCVALMSLADDFSSFLFFFSTPAALVRFRARSWSICCGRWQKWARTLAWLWWMAGAVYFVEFELWVRYVRILRYDICTMQIFSGSIVHRYSTYLPTCDSNNIITSRPVSHPLIIAHSPNSLKITHFAASAFLAVKWQELCHLEMHA